MNHSQILKRAWSILWSYRALWIFGILLALTTPSPNNPPDQTRYEMDERDLSRLNLPAEIRRGLRELNAWFDFTWTPETTRTVITWVIVAVVVLLLFAALFAILRYVSQTALIRMVDSYENTGEKAGWREGFRLGWSRGAWRLFLVNLVVFLPIFLVVLVLFGCAAIPVVASAFSDQLPTWSGVIATIGLVFVLIFLLFLFFLALSLVMEIVYRVVVLEDVGVWDGIRQGWQMVRSNLKDVFVLWLLLVGIQIGFLVIFLPLSILLFGLGFLIGGGAGIGMFALAQTLWSQTAGWISAVIVGLIVMMLVMGPPLLFIVGLKETYLSTTWTLAYRSLSRVSAAGLPAGMEAPVVES